MYRNVVVFETIVLVNNLPGGEAKCAGVMLNLNLKCLVIGENIKFRKNEYFKKIVI